ncbi:hypothetical protein ACFX12_031857 [Malus domestica]
MNRFSGRLSGKLIGIQKRPGITFPCHPGRACVTASGTPPDSIPLKHHDRNMDVEEGQGVRLVFSSGSAASKIMKLKQKYKETENGKFHVSEPVGVVNDRIEEDFASKEVPIEMFLGLTEFDGHEGVDSEFNEDDFSLHVSLC